MQAHARLMNGTSVGIGVIGILAVVLAVATLAGWRLPLVSGYRSGTIAVAGGREEIPIPRGDVQCEHQFMSYAVHRAQIRRCVARDAFGGHIARGRPDSTRQTLVVRDHRADARQVLDGGYRAGADDLLQ